MLTSSSNVGCWRWLGETSVAISGGTPVVDSRASAVGTLLWVVTAVMPGRIALGPSAGTIAGNTTITDVCTTTMVGERRELYRGLGDLGIPKPDGTLDFNLDLDLGFSEIGGESPNRELITLTGTTVLDTTITAVCPGVTTTSVGPHPWDWLTVDDSLSPGGPDRRLLGGGRRQDDRGALHRRHADRLHGQHALEVHRGARIRQAQKGGHGPLRRGSAQISWPTPPRCRTTPPRRSSAPSTSQRRAAG